MGLKGAVSFGLAAILLVSISIPLDRVAAARAARTPTRRWGTVGDDGFGFNRTKWTRRNTTIIVGGSEHWRFGFDYNTWAFKNGPFFQNDTLVFMYDPPSNGTFPHSVYQFKNFKSFMRCDLNQSTVVADVTQGGGEGFKFVLKDRKPYFFACGERNVIKAGGLVGGLWFATSGPNACTCTMIER
ncbi:hypothetical protein ACLOJK_016465 [Asimina triloba]